MGNPTVEIPSGVLGYKPKHVQQEAVALLTFLSARHAVQEHPQGASNGMRKYTAGSKGGGEELNSATQALYQSPHVGACSRVAPQWARGYFRGKGGLSPQLLSPLHESAAPRERRNLRCTRKTPPPSFLRNRGHFKLQHRATGARHDPTGPGAHRRGQGYRHRGCYEDG